MMSASFKPAKFEQLKGSPPSDESNWNARRPRFPSRVAHCQDTERVHESRTHGLFGRGLGNGIGKETPTAICSVACVDGATEGVTRKAAIGSLDADLRISGDRLMEPVTISCGTRFPPPLIFRRAKAPKTTRNEDTRLISKFRPVGLSHETANRVRIVRSLCTQFGALNAPIGMENRTMLPLNRLLEVCGSVIQEPGPLRYARESSDTPSVNAFC
jgi:hypothetical protein